MELTTSIALAEVILPLEGGSSAVSDLVAALLASDVRDGHEDTNESQNAALELRQIPDELGASENVTVGQA